MRRPPLLYITILVQMAAAIWAPFFWRRSSFSQRCVIVILLEMAVASIIELLMGMNGIKNLWVMHCSALIEFIIIIIMFYGWVEKVKEKLALSVTACSFLILWIIAKFTFESFDYLDVYTSIIAQIIYIILSVMSLFTLLKEPHISLVNSCRLWIVSGLLIYSAGTLFVVSLFNVIVESMPKLFVTLWQINWVLVILVTILFMRGVLCRATQ